jgi:hypothetical protein
MKACGDQRDDSFRLGDVDGSSARPHGGADIGRQAFGESSRRVEMMPPKLKGLARVGVRFEGSSRKTSTTNLPSVQNFSI